jgi:DNA polymerase-1
VSAVLIDTYSVFFRAFYALPPMQTSLGEPTSALYGFSVNLLKVLREHAPVALAFAIDAPQKTFRHEQFELYKAHRDDVPHGLSGQFDRLRQLLDVLEVPTFCVPGVEADDVIATLARELSSRQPVLVISGDRDLLQVTGDGARVLFIGARGKEPVVYDAAAVEMRYGIRPELLPSWVALAGDPSDNLPQVPGIGARTASKLIAQYGSIANLLLNVAEVKPPKVRDALVAFADQARTVERLARLRTDVPLAEGLRVAEVSGAALDRLRSFFAELEFKSLVARLDAWRRTLDAARQ